MNKDYQKDLQTWLKNTLGINPKNISLYVEALTHRSYANEHNQNISYQRLEYLGDSVLGFLTADYLYRAYPNKHEGELTTYRELKEELGVTAQEDDLIYCGDRIVNWDDEFRGKHDAKHPEWKANIFTYLAYDAVELFMYAVKDANSLDPEKIRDSLENAKDVKLYTDEHFTVDPATHNPLNKMVALITVKDGQFVLRDTFYPAAE